MKFFALLIVFLIATSAMGKINSVNKRAGRTASPEAIALTFIYLGTCEQFNTVRSSIAISAIPASGCLPLVNAPGFAVTDDIIADVLCTNIGRNRAQIDFVEIYQTTEANPWLSPYTISWVPNAPFKVLATGVNYLRRPSCTTQKDFCSTTNYVLNCAESPVALKNGYVISNDEVFVLVRGPAVGCGQAINTCCAYVNSVFCPRNASNAVLAFNWDSLNHHDDDHYGHNNNGYHGNNNGHNNGHHGNGHNNGHNNNHHNNNSYDNDDDDDNHGHHGNGHNNGHNGHNGHNNGHNNNGHHGHNNNGHHGHKNADVEETETVDNAVNNAVENDDSDDDKRKK